METALAQSIRRKKERIEELERSDNTAYNRIEIEFLQYEITEDEKLLLDERQMIESAYWDGCNNTHYVIGESDSYEKDLYPGASDYYNQHFKND